MNKHKKKHLRTAKPPFGSSLEKNCFKMNKNKDSCPSCESKSVESSSEYDTWLQCDACPLWYHVKCLEIKKVEMFERFHCPQCIGSHGPSTCKYTCI